MSSWALKRCCKLLCVRVQCVLLPLAQGQLLRDTRGATPAMYVEAAHECLLDLCLTPGLLADAFACLDCRLECSNLFEDITRVRRVLASHRAHSAMLVAIAVYE